MKSLVTPILFACSLLISSAPLAHDGQIHFVGNIVLPPCELLQAGKNYRASCVNTDMVSHERVGLHMVGGSEVKLGRAQFVVEQIQPLAKELVGVRRFVVRVDHR